MLSEGDAGSRPRFNWCCMECRLGRSCGLPCLQSPVLLSAAGWSLYGAGAPNKMTDLEDRSRRDNIRFLGFPENIEGEDIHAFLRETLPKLIGVTFVSPLKFQRADRLGPRRRPDPS
ncbi:hypothetical protein NDU88_003646 [Pleurodeles waltl]|uniref:Uncharacterized protein n=1 Tax=Pleurodeles waltl TaxID=8319 RepID=A0AAV7T787_PLEWA|nr:hypothetical protein NDU88_003646 [Pleurodeles waltl]